ncbi:hypothetical protein ACW675_04955 [Corynebacterium aurimucosum]
MSHPLAVPDTRNTGTNYVDSRYQLPRIDTQQQAQAQAQAEAEDADNTDTDASTDDIPF